MRSISFARARNTRAASVAARKCSSVNRSMPALLEAVRPLERPGDTMPTECDTRSEGAQA